MTDDAGPGADVVATALEQVGQRLRWVLPLAQAYRVSLDELVGAPEVGDPRVRLKPRTVNG